MRKTEKSINGTSFHQDTFLATLNQLTEVFGNPDNANNSGEDKCNFDWFMETEAGEVFTVYDWKEYRVIEKDEKIEWHIGGHNRSATTSALREILNLLI
jgi:hypothetical protein